MPLLFRCPECGAEWSTPGACRSCWVQYTFPVPVSRDGKPYGSPGARPHRQRRRPTRPLLEQMKDARHPKLVEFGYPSLRLPLNVSAIVTGPPGGGKSTFCTAMALGLALEGISVLWISVEEGTGPTTMRRFGQVLSWMGSPTLPKDTPLISDSRQLRDVHEEITKFEKVSKGVVFLDSLTVAGASTEWFEDISRGPLGIVAICHENSKGNPMGGTRPAYDTDVHIGVQDFAATIRKSRWYVDDAPQSWKINDIPSPASEEPTVIEFTRRRSIDEIT